MDNASKFKGEDEEIIKNEKGNIEIKEVWKTNNERQRKGKRNQTCPVDSFLAETKHN